MPVHQFMVSDLAGTSLAAALFTLVLFTPGYVLAWALDWFGFRRRSLPARAALAIPLSIAISPILAYLLEHYLPVAAIPFFIACGLALPPLIWRERATAFSGPSLRSAVKRAWPLMVVVAGSMAIAVLLLIDLQIGDRLYFPSVTHDYTVRAAITSAITRTGVPPHTPFFYSGQPWTLRYHYFWFILCSMVQRLGGAFISPRQAMLAGTAWAGAGLMCLVALCSQFFRAADRPRSDRTMLIAIGLLAVTGLDIVPVLLIDWSSRGFIPSVEWWNEPVMSWANAVLWVPHHVASLIACMAGFLLMWHGSEQPSHRVRIASAAAAGLMFASALGLSVYVTITFASSLAAWAGVSILRRHYVQPALVAISGLTALPASLPYLRELLAKSPAGAGSFPFQLAVRPMRLIDNVLGIASPFGMRANLTNLALLPLNYTLEWGFFALVAIGAGRTVWKRSASLSQGEWCAVTLGLTSFLVCTFVRSSVIENNDLGMRGMMIAQMILLLFAADLVAARLPGFSSPARAAAGAAIALGVLGTVYEVAMVRFYPLLLDTTSTGVFYPWVSHDRHMGARTYALREIYEQLKESTPEGAILQHNPDIQPEDPFHGMYADRQVAAETLDCGVSFGGDEALCPGRIAQILRLFDDPVAFDAAQIDDVCSRLSIGVLVVKDTDRVWDDRSDWVWSRKPAFANRYARAFECGVSRPGRKVAVAWK
jgi:hypothetical protein